MPRIYHKVNEPKREVFFGNLWGGLAWGMGASLGVGLIIALLGFIANHINFVPIVGNFTSQVINYILQNNSGLIK